MADNKIPGGYILLSRKVIESEIMKKPPLYLKVWVWLLLNAQHKEFGGLARGQCRTSVQEISEAMSYRVGYRIEKPSYKEIRGIIEWLRRPYEGQHEGHMMGTTKVTHGIVCTICNYDIYQTPENYEGQHEGRAKVARRSEQGQDINKNVKNDKNDKNKELKDIVSGYTFDPTLMESINDFVAHRKAIKKPLSVRGLELTLKNLDKLTGNDREKVDILNQSIANGWQGVFALKDDAAGRKQSDSKFEKSISVMAEWLNEQEVK